MLRLLALLCLPALLAGVLSLATSKLVSPQEQPQQWVIWDGTAFSNPAAFGVYLRAHRQSYGDWAQSHPAAAARLEGRPPPPGKTARQDPRAAASKPQAPAPAKAPSGDARSISSSRSGETAEAAASRDASARGAAMVLVLLLGVAILVVGVASLPQPLLQALKAPVILVEHRLELTAVGGAILLGMAVAQLLTS